MSLPRMPIALLLLITLTPAPAMTLYVTPEGPGLDGLSWETAFALVGDAIGAATAGDEIWVASGTYNETIDLIDGISLFGGFAGTESEEEVTRRNWKRFPSILDGSDLYDHVVRGASGTTLDGIIIQNGTFFSTLYDYGGAGILCKGDMILRNSVVRHNRCFPDMMFGTGGDGGGILMGGGKLVLLNCIIENNFAANTGGGISSPGGDLFLSNCLLSRNDGCAIEKIHDGTITLENCTFGIGNEDRQEPCDFRSGQDGDLFINTIIRHPSRWGGETIAYHSNIPDNTGPGNIDSEPQWVDPENGDYRLKISSPCIDSGTITDATMDLDGNPRPIDVVGIGTDGPGAYDMGAFEFQLSPADLTRNGTVDGEDLMEFQTKWMWEE